MSSPHMYIDHTGDFDRTLVTVYTFAKYLPVSGSKLTVLERDLLTSEQKLALNELYSVNFTSGELPIQYFLNNVDNIHNITGRVFTEHSSQSATNSNKIAVVCYIYWFDIIPEIANYIKRLSSDHCIDLYIYMCDINRDEHKQQALKWFTEDSHNINVMFEWVPNRGRDVWSFLKFIIDGRYEQYDYICKIHTKKSTYLDNEWRQNLFENLLLVNNVKRHWSVVDRQKISGTDRYGLWEVYNSTNPNFNSLTSVLKLYGKSLEINKRYKFHAGTMFWCNRELCQVVNEKLSINYIYEFNQEPIPGDGTLAHGWERAFHVLWRSEEHLPQLKLNI